MAEKPINLRLRRKQKAREEKRARGNAGTNTPGVTRLDRELSAKITSLEAAKLDQQKLEPAESVQSNEIPEDGADG